MFSLSLYPLLLKPNIINNSATLIDNIFVNLTDKGIKSVLLVTDIRDHLSVFVVFESRTLIPRIKETYRLLE